MIGTRLMPQFATELVAEDYGVPRVALSPATVLVAAVRIEQQPFDR